ncbi:uncharacterized protein LOC119667346 [Teleopsis dalmanni]|uniref:uncharacterized protein LOC119667346 n=1 Tax=Teleopsis dalmanni TaxID=139649 RepID=UPI0018CCB64F|nr:uncharacterized protein LOC119667346 [Teleopsis dalmanni]
MGNLPRERITPARPFERCGVDFCGPINTHFRIRGKRPYKTYIAIFICFVTKAVHIETVSDLSADAFIAALKRLIGRRGIPSNIFCDNATNFVGANSRLNEFKQLITSAAFKNTTEKFCANHFIKFNFIPPRSPHFGGLWEAAVKSAKGHLFRSLANAKMTIEELMTALIEIEAVMNSRPISPLSNDPNDLEALTPGHFLIGTPINSLPEPIVDNHDLTHLERWKRIAAVKQQFWCKWSNEYLGELIQRHRWTSIKCNIKLDDLVWMTSSRG